MRRHEARQKALQALYQVDVGKTETNMAIQHVLEDTGNVREADLAYVGHLVEGTRAHIADIDQMLSTHVEGWALDRIAKVDLNVLRLALFELLHEKDVDVATVVNEAVELAKDFSSDESGKFVNGVLARLLPTVAEARK